MSYYVQSMCDFPGEMNQSQGFISSNLRVINIVDDIDQSLKNVNMNVSKDLVAAAGFNVETPIVSAIIGNITGILPTKKNVVTEVLKCEICDCEITSNSILEYHINGSRHRKKVKLWHPFVQPV